MPSTKTQKYTTVITKNRDLIQQAQLLRASVFFKDSNHSIDHDHFDDIFEHLIVLHDNQVVGTYRLQKVNKNTYTNESYIQTEFDISSLLDNNFQLLELGRACVHPQYRNGAVIGNLWRGIADFMQNHEIDYMIGCVSFEEANIDKHAESIAYLLSQHRSTDNHAPTPIKPIAYDLQQQHFDKEKTFMNLPAMMKGYIRVGMKFCDGIIEDPICNTIDMCGILKRTNISQRYLKKFSG